MKIKAEDDFSRPTIISVNAVMTGMLDWPGPAHQSTLMLINENEVAKQQYESNTTGSR